VAPRGDPVGGYGAVQGSNNNALLTTKVTGSPPAPGLTNDKKDRQATVPSLRRVLGMGQGATTGGLFV
jgi:hypothetical protein